MCDKIKTYPGPSVLSLALFNPSNLFYDPRHALHRNRGRGERKWAEKESKSKKDNKEKKRGKKE